MYRTFGAYNISNLYRALLDVVAGFRWPGGETALSRPDIARTCSYHKAGSSLTTTVDGRCLCPLRPVNQQHPQHHRAKARNEENREAFC
jgi:hypothetical protein